MDKLNFKNFSTAVESQFNRMTTDADVTLVRVGVDNDALWDMYLNSYPQEFNGIFRERRNYDCNCCKNFIRRVGNLIALKGDQVISVWDVQVEGYFQQVADAMAAYVKSARIDNLFATSEKIAGGLSNIDNYDTNIRWDHFYAKVPEKFVHKNADIGSTLGEFRANRDVLARSLVEIKLDSAETVLELIQQNSLYRGSEYKLALETFIKHKKEFDALPESQRESYVWQASKKLGTYGRIKNTAIGTLLIDLSEGVDLEKAVASFENKVSGTNYKRTTALVTPSMIKMAQEKIESLGLGASLERRFARKDDITVNNVIFSSVHAKPLNVFDDLLGEASRKVDQKKLSKVETISIDKFLTDVLPNSQKLEVMFESKHKSNLMSLVAPQHESSENMFKWNNKYSWAYNGDVTDTIKERVKNNGGCVEGDLRVSLSWYNADDLDLSCVEPTSNVIMYNRKKSAQTGGMLDLDMNGLDKKDSHAPVENLIYVDKKRMVKGDYVFRVHNYSRRSTENVGFAIQIEFDGVSQTFAFDKAYTNGRMEKMFVVNWDGEKFTVKDIWSDFTSNSSAKETVWNVNSGEFVPVSMVMNSPNHWDGNKVGNKHVFFILDGCKNDEPVRGFFNEYLKPELNDIRKTIELLGSKMKAEPTEEQLSGIGFSETIRNELTVRVTGKTQRVFKINF